ncbi:MAG: hypothetical protein ABIR32_02040 [Ilumatobacteraceae bacterium]
MINPVRLYWGTDRARPRAIRRTLAAAILLGSLAACGSSSSTASPATVGVTASSNADPAPNATDSEGAGSVGVPKLLQFSAPLVTGGEFAGADQAGRATAFWFWAPT